MNARSSLHQRPDPLPRLDRSVAGRIVLLVGGANALGRAIALTFAREGAFVAVTDADGIAAEAVAAEIVAEGGHGLFHRLDVANEDACWHAVGALGEAMGGIDILVVNATPGSAVSIDDPGYDERWSRQLTVQLTACQRIIRAALPFLEGSDAPRIVNIAPGDRAGLTLQAAASAGVMGLTRALAAELRPDRITVNGICVATPGDRSGAPEAIADVVLNLALPSASLVTGAVIPVGVGGAAYET